MVLQSLARQAGAEADVFAIVRDDYETILATLGRAVESDYDLIIINAGSSAGSEDYTATAIGELGEVLVHGVTIMPGKPTILGRIKGKPVVGNPGYPVSAVISFEQFVEPLLARWQSGRPHRRATIRVTPSQAFPSKLGLEEFLRVKLGRIDERIVAVPLPRGAGSITTLTQADGVIRIPADSEGVGTEETVMAELLRPLEDIEGTLIAIGSHDNTWTCWGTFCAARDPGMSLSAGNLGAWRLLTLKRGLLPSGQDPPLDTETATTTSPISAST